MFDTILASALPQSPANIPRLYIDTSTIDPITSRAIAADVASASAGTFIDAPMSGGVVGAEAGALTFMLGAPANLVPQATDILSLMGKRVVHLGDQGAGLCGKLANNYLLALNNIATAEAMSMGIRWGLDPKVLAGMINTATGRCWPSEINNPVPGVISTAPASRGYIGGFGIGLMAKDLRLALQACDEYGVKLGMGETARKIYADAEKDEKCKGKDFSSVYLYLDGPTK